MCRNTNLLPHCSRLPGLTWALILLTLLYGSAALAEFRHGPISLSAFGTLGGAWSSNREADYTLGIQPSGPGRSYDFDLGMDSRLGAQMDIGLSRTTTLTAQAVVDRNAYDRFLPRLTLGQLRQEFFDHFSLRAGRMQNPMFLAAEYRLANFANPWVRTPNVLYDAYPMVSLDGAELSYRRGTPMGTISLRSGYGWFDFDVPISIPRGRGYYTVRGSSRNLHFVTAQLEQGPWRIKAGWVRGYTDLVEPGMMRALSFLRALGDSRAAERLTILDKPGQMFTVGAAYDGPDWLFMGEWACILSPGSLTNRHLGYVTLGHHFGQFMPQVTLGYADSFAPDVRGANPFSQAVLDAMYRGASQDQWVAAVGLNYSVTDSVVLRSQLDLIQPQNHSNGPYSMNQTDRYNAARPSLDYLFSVSLDFVY